MEKLKQVLAQEDTVLFIGSGISMWSGLPSWSELIEELAGFLEATGYDADLVRAEARRGDLLQAASYGFSRLTKPQVGDFIRKACRYGVAKPCSVHQKLVSLGPRCFVTTNYDDLIEQSLRTWRPDNFFPPPVTNRNLTEMADIIHARATDFIFKPHGDAADSDSIILTREQYRQLLPEGDRHATLESLRTLLATRPVVYVGYGLRDPDFSYVRDLLSNTYKGGIRDHYAIMADVDGAEIEYWRKEYGIHLVGYTTKDGPRNSRDHGPLLELLDTLIAATSAKAPPAPTAGAASPFPPSVVLALARHAARLTRAEKKYPEFPLRVHEDRGRRGERYRLDKFDHWPVERFLDEGPDRALLIGDPGSGKSYSLLRAAARLGERLHANCLSEVFEEKSVVIPLLADLKMYRGNLANLVSQTLPSGLSLDHLAKHSKLKIFLDSFNEMAREYWETGLYEADFARFVETNNASIIIGSRTSDGLCKLDFPSYNLDEIDDSFLDAELERLKINVTGRFRHEVRQLLKRPFYFQLAASRTISLPDKAHPRDFYKAFFDRLTRSFQGQFGKRFNVEQALSLCGYEAVNRGEEAQPLAGVLEILQAQLQGAGLVGIRAQDVANWLVSRSVVIPYRGARAAFFHQSATEYLAARELARRYHESPQLLKEKLSLRRWDQALFLTLSLLPPAEAEGFLEAVVETDFPLALKAAKYVETGREGLVAKLLAEIPDRLKGRGPFDSRIEWALRSGPPISDVHEPQIRMLMSLGGSIGAAAVTRLIELKGASVKEEMLQSLARSRNDYDYCCNGIGKALMPFASPADIQRIVSLADSVQKEVPPHADDQEALGFVDGAASFLAGLDLALVRRAFLPEETSEPLSEIRERILCYILWHHHSAAALDLSAELILRGVRKAATAITFISKFGKLEDRLSWSAFSCDHADRLASMLDDEDEEAWALRALKHLCRARPDIAEFLTARAAKTLGIKEAALLYCARPTHHSVFEALAKLTVMSAEERGAQPIHLVEQMELDWEGHETLFVKLLRLRDARLALALLEPIYLREDVPELEIGAVDWWLEWLFEKRNGERGYWLCDRMAWLFAASLNTGARKAFVLEFNKADSKFRELLAHVILPHFPDITSDEFGEEAISFLLSSLSRPPNSFHYRGHLLAMTATELLVTERLLPLLPGAKPPFSTNLRGVLREAGLRHGRRYVDE